jgi:hypothetical protein
VAEPHAKYTGETRFPLIIQNTHRYFFYIAAIISLINTYDAIVAMHSPSGSGSAWATSSCGQRHHAVGLHGVVPHLPARHRRPAQALLQTPCAVLDLDPGQQAQHHHKKYAWITLGTLMFTDFYIMLVAGDLRPEIHWLTSESLVLVRFHGRV